MLNVGRLAVDTTSGTHHHGRTTTRGGQQMSDDAGTTGPDRSVVPLGPAEYLGPAGTLSPEPPEPETGRFRFRRPSARSILALVVAAAVVVVGAGVVWFLQALPKWQVASAAQATIEGSGIARVTLTGMQQDELAYEFGWSRDPGALSFAVLNTGGPQRTWVRVVSADGKLYAQTDIFSHDMIRAIQHDAPVPELPDNEFGAALAAGDWVELATPGDAQALAGTGVGLLDDEEARAQVGKLRELLEDGVRGSTTVTKEGEDARGERYRVTIDLAQAALANADELESVLTELAGQWADSVVEQLGDGAGMTRADVAPEVDVRKAAADLKPLPLTLWLRDGRVAALRMSPHDMDESAPEGARLDVEFRELPGPLVPTDAVVVTSAQLEELAGSMFGLSSPDDSLGLQDRPRLRDEQGRIWIKVDKTFAMPEDPGVQGMATKRNGVWRDLEGNLIVLVPAD